MRIDHVGVAVPDLDAAIAHYQQVFGMRCVHQETNQEQGVREAMLAVGDTPEAGHLQLLAPLTPDSPIARFLDRRGPGVQQVAFTVTDVAAAGEGAARVGCGSTRNRRGTAGSRINFVHPKDAGGCYRAGRTRPARPRLTVPGVTARMVPLGWVRYELASALGGDSLR